MLDKKTLVIGLTGISGVKCLDWMDLNAIPNIAIYQRVVVVEPTLIDLIDKLRAGYDMDDTETDRKGVTDVGRALSARLGLAKTKLSQAGGRVYAIVSPYRHFVGDSKWGSTVESSQWHPLPFSLRAEEWDHAVLADETFSGYFAISSSWTHSLLTTYAPADLEHLLSGELEPKPQPKLVMNVLASDWQGFTLATELRFQLHRGEKSFNAIVYQEDAYLTSGAFTLLPSPRPERIHDAACRILVDFCELQPSAEDPTWLNTVSLPGEKEASATAERLRQTILDTELSLREAESALAGITRFKRLLSEKSWPLQQIVKETFRELGFETPDSPVSDEFLLAFQGETLLVEVTGSDKSIATRDLSQLVKDLGKYLEETGSPVKGLFVANPWRLLPPQQRNTNDRPTFPDDVKKTAKTFSVALLGCDDLLEIYRRVRAGSVSPSEVFDTLSTSVGVVCLPSKSIEPVHQG